VETDGNFAWTRAAAGITVRFDVNPTTSTTVTYPAESTLCANPVNAPKPAALPATGGVDMTPWGTGAALMLIAGTALLTARRLARR
jgi:LPXTG-motif cell wall-anchored protein